MDNENTLNNKTTTGRVVWLDFARFIAIISISMNHAVAAVYGIFSLSHDDFNTGRGIFSETFRAVCFVFSRLGVPLFLMLSGVLLLKKHMDTAEDVWKFFKHNLLSLFIAAEIWYGIMYFVRCFWDPDIVSEKMSAFDVVKGFICNAVFINQITFDSMWYMRMILLVYLLIPVAIIIKNNRLNLWPAIIAVIIATIMITFCVPDAIKTLNAFEIEGQRKFTLSQGHLFSQYWVYIAIGFWIGEEKLAGLKNHSVVVGLILSFLITSVYQYIMFAAPKRVAIGYECTFLLICSVFLFEFLRRVKVPEFMQNGITYISRISLGIYFVHIIILSLVDWYVTFPAMAKSVETLLLWGISFVGSIAIIVVLERIKFCREVLLIIK